MNDRLTPLTLEQLADWALWELDNKGSLFGLQRSLFFTPKTVDPFSLERFGRRLETPIGVAAGPHTQLAQNIVTAWAAGARYIELKTVQTLDQLDIPRPCIDMEDEGYNCEWSQELSLEQSLQEYCHAWLLINLLRQRLGHPGPGPGFLFNLSVGYDLAGIRQANMQHFLNQVADCRACLEAGRDRLATLAPEAAHIQIPKALTDNVTLSTMHGCPPREIATIARYLMEEWGLHTIVKLNPTLPGADTVRGILNRQLGYATQVPDTAFAHDPGYAQGLDLIRELQQVAAAAGVAFGLKLTNTLECRNHRGTFPAQVDMMYLSGRALHPLAVSLAARLRHDLGAELDISFSAGADTFNLPTLLACNLLPVTVCSDILKPGGYGRLRQYLDQLGAVMHDQGAGSLVDLMGQEQRTQKISAPRAAWKHLLAYSKRVAAAAAYQKQGMGGRSIKTARPLTTFDCVAAPCRSTCPAGQEVGEYMAACARGDDRTALAVVLRSNALPLVTGIACDHTCTTRCTRQNIDQALHIRAVKRFIAEQAVVPGETAHQTNRSRPRVAIIGAGPTGLAAAWELARAGCAVTVYEQKALPGGLAAYAIPPFRLQRAAIARDVARIEAAGARLLCRTRVDRVLFQQLRQDNDYVILAMGARQGRRLGIDGEDLPGVWDALQLLEQVREGERPRLGKRALVIGGGNSAVDAARTALRLTAFGGSVQIVYRRTRAQMPADQEELVAALEEGVAIRELLSPHTISPQKRSLLLTCQQMELGPPGADGRPRPLPLPDTFQTLAADSIVIAVGQQVVADFLEDGLPETIPGQVHTNQPGLLIGGDALRGPATLIQGIADGRRAALAILAAAGLAQNGGEWSGENTACEQANASIAAYHVRLATRDFGPVTDIAAGQTKPGFEPTSVPLSEPVARREAARCLQCDQYCEVCVTVCPNRALQAFSCRPLQLPLWRVTGDGNDWQAEAVDQFTLCQTRQVYQIAEFCNQCGNCETFCPTAGAPFRDKPRFRLTVAGLQEEEDGYLLYRDQGRLAIAATHQGHLLQLSCSGQGYHYREPGLRLDCDSKSLAIQKMESAHEQQLEVVLDHLPILVALLQGMEHSIPARLARPLEGDLP